MRAGYDTPVITENFDEANTTFKALTLTPMVFNRIWQMKRKVALDELIRLYDENPGFKALGMLRNSIRSMSGTVDVGQQSVALPPDQAIVALSALEDLAYVNGRSAHLSLIGKSTHAGFSRLDVKRRRDMLRSSDHAHAMLLAYREHPTYAIHGIQVSADVWGGNPPRVIDADRRPIPRFRSPKLAVN